MARYLGLTWFYTDAKGTYLRVLARAVRWHYLDAPNAFRNAMKSQYRPDVSVHLQDQAVFDAADTMKRFIEASIASSHMRGKVFARYQGPQRRYAYWLLRRYERIGAVLQGKTPTPEPFDVAPSDRKDAMRFVRRSLRQSLGTPPRVRVRRSFALDSTLYRVFEERGQQYIAITSMTPGKRVVLPLRGSGRITGNVRVVLHPRSRSVSIHTTDDVKVPEPHSSAGCIGLDAGVTEVIASSTGYKYGRGYGKLLDRKGPQQTSPISHESRSEGGWCKSVPDPKEQPGPQATCKATRPG